MKTPTPRTAVAALALALAAACGGGGDGSAADSPAAGGTATSTPPQSEGPMNMVDSATRAPQTADSLPPGAQPRDSTRRDSAAKRP
jgi:hypothetical protein